VRCGLCWTESLSHYGCRVLCYGCRVLCFRSSISPGSRAYQAVDLCRGWRAYGQPNMTFEGRFLPRFIPWHMCSFLVVFSCSAQQPRLSEGCERSQCARFPCMASGGVLIQAACLSATCSYQPASYTNVESTHASYCIQLCV
jgi:hypothetical protein